MSLLVGVRGQSRDNEGPGLREGGLREGITQQPSPFYNNNPSSIIWGNKPTPPNWRDDSGGPSFNNAAAFSGFGILPQQQQQQQAQKKEKEKEGTGAGMVGGEGRASFNSRGRRYPTRVHSGRNNSNPNSWGFGFSSQFQTGSAHSSSSSSVPGFGLPRSSVFTFGSTDNDAAAIPNTSGPAREIPIPQDDRMEDITEVIPVFANMTVNDRSGDPKFVDKSDEQVRRASGGAAGHGEDDASPSPWVLGSDVSRKFSNLGLSHSSVPATGEKGDAKEDAPAVFVFGAKLSGNDTAARPKPKPTPDVTPSARPRLLKVKRSVSSAKGKAIATGNNGASSLGGTPSQEGSHEKGSQSSSVSGECSFSQPSVLGMGSSPYGPTAAVPVGPTVPFTRDGDSAAPKAFASSSPLFPTFSAQENSALGRGERHDCRRESEATPPAFFNFDIAYGSDHTEEPATESDVSIAAADLLRTSLDDTDVSQSSFNLFGREEPSTISSASASRNECTDEGLSSGGSLNISLDDYSDNASKNASGEHDFPSSNSFFFAEGRAHSVQDLSSDLALKLGLGSAGTVPGADSNGTGKFRNPAYSTEDGAVGPQGEQLPTRNIPPAEEGKTAAVDQGRNRGQERLQPPSSSFQTGDFPEVGKDTIATDAQRRSFHFVNRADARADGIPANPHPFVFGASLGKSSSTKPGSAAAAPFRFSATSTPTLSPTVSFDIGGASSGTIKIPASHLPSSKHRSPRLAASDGGAAIQSSSREESEAVPFSLSSFNLGAGRRLSSVKADDDGGPTRETQNVSPSSGVPPPAPAPPSFVPANSDSDGSSSYFSAPSSFVFSAGTSTASAASSSQATPNPMGGQEETSVKEKDSAATSDFFDADSSSQQQPPDDSVSGGAFEFRASSEGGSVSGSGGKGAFGRRKSLRTPGSRRQSRSSTTSKEKKNSSTFAGFADTSGNVDEERGSPMDFSPQRYTPPDETVHDLQKAPKQQPAWASSMYTDWSQYSETDVAMENLRNAANDLAFGGQPGGGRSPWQQFGQEEGQGESWSGGKENVPRRSTSARNGKWKRAVLDESQGQGPVQGQERSGGTDNIWKGFSLGSAREPKSAASSSTPSVDSSGSSGGWGQFTFTAGSSPNFSSTTSFLRRHARRIQRERSGPGSSEALKPGGSKSTSESLSSLLQAGVKLGPSVVGGATASAAGAAASGAATSTTNHHSVFPFDPPVSASGSLPRPDGVKPVSPKTVGAAATEQLCERWRLRGNQAYANGDFPKAEEYYSRGASSVPPNETSQSCIRASMLCYSNRAATRMVVGRMREALADCMRAMAVDPNFLRVRLRAASCHLALGETASAARAFKECLQRAKEEDQLDVKVSSEAAEGFRKSSQVDEYLDRAQEILANGSSGDTPAALRLLNEALLSSPHSERAIELKSRALLVLRRYEEVVQLCEQSLLTAERNNPLPNGDSAIHQLLQAGGSDTATKYTGATSPLRMWRWQLSAKAKFYLGRLEDALEDLRKFEIAYKDASQKTNATGPSPHADAAALSIGTICDLLRHKAAGNEAFQCGKHTEAVEHYSAALACNGDSRPFNAVCFCNRAAASQALGNIGDAISDCSRAIALDPKYAKAISRRATLHEKVRDYGQSCHDLQRLITLLEGHHQQARAALNLGWVGRPATNAQQDLSQARDRLAKVEDEMKKGHPLDHYMILGLESGCSSVEVKKAYRKAALRHHPDKAGQFLGRSEGGDDGGMWKEVADEVRSDAERLFKLIGEANAILSDSQKRIRYDAEEEFRKLRTRTSAATSGLSEMYRHTTTERGQAGGGGGGGGGRRTRDRWGDHGRDTWSGYSHQQQRWQSGPDAAQPDTYARRGRYGSNNSSRNGGEGDRWNDYDWDDV